MNPFESSTERDQSISIRHNLHMAALNKYKLEVNQVHSTYEVFVVGDLSELQIALVVLLAVTSYTTLVVTGGIMEYELLSVMIVLMSFIPVVMLLLGLRLKRKMSAPTCVFLGNATIVLHSTFLSVTFMLISLDLLHFGDRTREVDLVLSSMILVISLAVLPCVLRCHSPLASALSWFIAESSCVVGALLSPEPSLVWYVFPALMAVVGIQMYSFEQCILSSYNHLVGLEGAVRVSLDADNQQRVLKMQSNEMRSLIGNVAHDLKTPMQAFSLELKELSTVISDYVRTMETGQTHATAAAKTAWSRCHVDAMQSIRILEDTVHFMLMTINRAIDFTKASTGISLSASNSTVDIVDCMQWVQHLMSNSQARIPITFRPPSDLVCTHLITDKQVCAYPCMHCLLTALISF